MYSDYKTISSCVSAARFGGSSPLTRGTRVEFCLRLSVLRFIPAYAGNSMVNSNVAQVPTVHPRLRGELSLRKRESTSTTGSSPLTRGTPKKNVSGSLADTVHPRLRGELGVFSLFNRIEKVHPRLRGELVRSPFGAPSKPRFIPAYAGNSFDCG